MQESIGGISLTVIVITLVLLFAGIITLTINRSNAIAVKSQIVDIIEDSGGFDMNSSASFTDDCYINRGDEALCDILKQLTASSYRQTGKCDDGEVGYNRDGSISTSNEKVNFCIKQIAAGESMYYYKVTVFYSVDLPVIKQIFNLKSTGQTKLLYR